MTKCNCGSGKNRYELLDAKGIFVSYVCDNCIRSVMDKYRPEVFTDAAYWTDEPVEEEP